MGVALSLARAALRRRRVGLAGLALLIALGVGVAVAAFEAAERTARAYPTYLREAQVADLVVNPGFATTRAEEIIASTPGVESYATHDFLIATTDDGHPRTQLEVDGEPAPAVWMSTDGRFVDQDRPIIRRGRMVGSGNEAFVSVEVAETLGLDIGDELPLAFWAPSYLTPGVGPQPSDVVEAVGRSSVTVVGIGTFADEVLVDDLYPRGRIVVPPDVGARQTCTQVTPAADDDRPLQALVLDMAPSDCALAYRYFALRLEDGDAGIGPVTDHLRAAFERENAQLPPQLLAEDIGYLVIPTATQDQRDAVERSLAPVVTSIRTFALVAAGSTVIVAILLMWRMQRRDQDEVATWRSLGMTTGQRLVAITGPFAATVVVGILGAAIVGWSTSGVGPVASAERVDPHAGLGLSLVALPVLGAALVVLLTGALVSALAMVRARRTRPVRVSVVVSAAAAAGPARALGVRAAVAGVGAGAVLVGSMIAVGVVQASLVFSSSVDSLVEDTANYGWPYDAAVMLGFGYGGADEEAIAQTLDRSEVATWGIANLAAVSIDGTSMAGVSARQGFTSIPPTVGDGRLPTGDDEVAIGIKTAAELGIGVGDEVTVANEFGTRTAIVTGTVVLPAVGPFESARAATGSGALLSEGLFAGLVADAEAAAGLEPGAIEASGLGAFVVIDLVDGVEAPTFLAAVDDQLRSWDRAAFMSLPLPSAVRPPVIAEVEGVRRVPVALGSFFAVAMAGALGVGIAVATRARRHELALLRALGSSDRDVRRSVRWHALTVVGAALLVGVPLGIAGGRLLYGFFADDIGVVPTTETPVLVVLAVIAATIIVGLLASAGPGRSITRQPAATVLRQE